MKSKKPVTLESVAGSIDDVLGIVKNVHTKVGEFRTEVNDRLDDIEVQIGPQSRRIDRLEDKVRQISVKIGFQK